MYVFEILQNCFCDIKLGGDQNGLAEVYLGQPDIVQIWYDMSRKACTRSIIPKLYNHMNDWC